MKLKRFRRAVAAWWWVAVLVGLVGVGAGVFAVQQWNSSITRVFEAQTYFPIVAEASGQRGEVSAGPLQDALERANEVNSDLLSDEVVITANQDQYALVFSVRAADAESAQALAEEMRTNFVTAEFGAVGIEERMELVVAEAISVSAAIKALEPTVVTVPTTELTPTEQARLDFLLIQANALRDESQRLVGDLVLAETGETRNGTVDEINAAILSVGEKLEAIYVELETTPGFEPSMLEETSGAPQAAPQATEGETQPEGQTEEERTAGTGAGRSTDVSIPEDDTEIGPNWQMAALQDRYAELQTEYQTLFELSIDDEPDTLAAATTQDATPERLPVPLGALAGFGAGSLLGALAMLLVGRLRRPIWATSDMSSVVFVTEVPAPPSKSTSRSGQKRLEKRRRAIRDLRTSVNGVLEAQGTPMSIGLVGVGASAADTRQLALDLGSSLQAVDRAVLVIDVGFQASRRNVSNLTWTLSGLLDLVRANSEYANSQLKEALAEMSSGHSSVTVLPAGSLQENPADVLLSRAFSQLLADTLTYVDVVLIPTLDLDFQSAADSLFQRLDGVIAVCHTRTSRRAALVSLARRLDQRSAELLGGALLVGRQSRSLEPQSHDAGDSGGLLDSVRSPRAKKAKKHSAGVVSVSQRLAGQDKPVHVQPESPSTLATHRYKSRLSKARVQVRVPTSRWRALPDFLVIGAQRSGTSSLYKYLGQHPSVVPSIRKETEFFTTRHAEGKDWYRAHFPLGRDKSNELNGHRRLTFEADPSYLLDPRAPSRASSLLPDAKIIVLLRDPVERAISHYYHNVRIGQEQVSLRNALDLEESRIGGEVERMLRDPEYPAKNYLRYSYASRGIYAEQLERWLEYYPTERVRVVHSADFFAETAGVYDWLLDFLELPHWQPDSFDNFSYPSGARENGSVKRKVVEAAVKEQLREFFAPHNARLYDLIDQDFGW